MPDGSSATRKLVKNGLLGGDEQGSEGMLGVQKLGAMFVVDVTSPFTLIDQRFACAIPALTRSRSISRSNSATAPRT